jgi:hypothetical protein
LQLNADDRIGAEEALRHRYFSPLPRKLYELPDGEFCFTTLSYLLTYVTSTRKVEILLTAENREGIVGSAEKDSKETGCSKCVNVVRIACVSESSKLQCLGRSGCLSVQC